LTFDTAVGSKDSEKAPAPGTAGKRGNLNSRQIIRNLSEFGVRKKNSALPVPGRTTARHT